MTLTADWKKVPAKATRRLLADCNRKPVKCYQKGEVFEAWLEFEIEEGGYVWHTDDGTDVNPTHYLPAAAA